MQDDRKKNYIWGHDDCDICHLARDFIVHTACWDCNDVLHSITHYSLQDYGMTDLHPFFVTMVGIILSLLVGGIALLSVCLRFWFARFVDWRYDKDGKSQSCILYMASGSYMFIIMVVITYVAAVLLFNFNFIR